MGIRTYLQIVYAPIETVKLECIDLKAILVDFTYTYRLQNAAKPFADCFKVHGIQGVRNRSWTTAWLVCD